MTNVTIADPDEWETVLPLLFAHSPPAEQVAHVHEVLESVGRGEISLDGLLTARQRGKTVGVALYVHQPDETIFVWPPAVSSAADKTDSITDILLGAIRQHVDRSGVWLAQCLLEPESASDRAALSRNGFPHLADLHYLRRPLTEPLPPLPRSLLHTEVYRPAENTGRFARLLERTYAGSLDCPALDGLRNGEQALRSHRAAGKFDPARWKIYRVAESDVGVLLLNAHADQNVWEVVYMGIVPEARGQGYGRAMLLTGLHEAQAAGCESVLLAVDGRNHYAINLYRSLGFCEWMVRSVHTRTRTTADPDR